MAKLKKTKVVEAAPPPKPPEPPPYQPKTPVTDEVKRELYREARTYWEEQADHYGWEDPMPDHMLNKAQRIMAAVDLETASQAVAKFKVSTEWAMLGAWSRRAISGPNTPESLARRAKRAESLAKMLDDKGLHEQAEQQRARARDLYQASKAKVRLTDVGA